MHSKIRPLIGGKYFNPASEDLKNLYNLSLKTGLNYFKFYNKSENIICEKAANFPNLACFSNYKLNLKNNTWFSAQYLNKLADVSLKHALGLVSFSGFEKIISILAVENENCNLIWESFPAETSVEKKKNKEEYLNLNSTCSTDDNEEFKILEKNLKTIKVNNLNNKNLEVVYIDSWYNCNEFLAFSDIALIKEDDENKNKFISIWLGGRRGFYLEPLTVFLWQKNLPFNTENDYKNIKYLIEDLLAWWVTNGQKDEFLAETVLRFGRENFVHDFQKK